MKTEEFIYISEGSRILLTDKAYRYQYAFFSLERPERYLYTYAYQEEEHWCTYKSEYSSDGFLTEDTEFTAENLPPEKAGYIKISVEPAAGMRPAADEKPANGTESKADEKPAAKAESEAGEKPAAKTESKADEKPTAGMESENGVGVDMLDDILEVCGGISESEALSERERNFVSRDDVKREIQRTATAVEQKRGKDSLVFTLLTDTHYVINGNWETCAATIEAVNSQIHPDGVIHLGDLTDGILDKEICKRYSRRVLDRIRGWGTPFYLTIGNHDVNYFKKNPDILSREEQYEYYLKNTVSGSLMENRLWYDADFPKYKLRCLFLHSYDNEEALRYGFPQEEISWAMERLMEMPEDYLALIFSHDAPLARLDYWAKEIRNGERLTELLETWHRQHGERILAFIHGHTHADFIYRKRAFPIISIGCAKLEYFEDKKPEGAIAYVREQGNVTQELWDTMLVDTAHRRLDFVRFGAGEDRSVAMGKEAPACREAAAAEKPDGVAEESEGVTAEKRNGAAAEKQDGANVGNGSVADAGVKIWAHRGASGYAPENTLEAFALAQRLGADGVELDVQLTKDREIVVIHDERIDRVSDGRGYVADYTLEELRRFNFNRTHPEYVHADIPTLREVLELLEPAGLTVNIELKTGVNFYPGIERATVELVRELGMQERVIYSSFNHASVMKVRELEPEARTGFLYCDGTLDMAEYAKAHGVCALHPARYNMKYPGFVEACRDKGVSLHVWTVNDKSDMEKMVQLGVDAIITNYPDRACEVIHGKKVSVPEPPGTGQGLPTEAPGKSSAGTPGTPSAGTPGMSPAGTPETPPAGAPEKSSAGASETPPAGASEKSSAGMPETPPAGAPEKAPAGTSERQEETKKQKNILLHAAGLLYGRARRVFVRLDNMVQKAAGK